MSREDEEIREPFGIGGSLQHPSRSLEWVTLRVCGRLNSRGIGFTTSRDSTNSYC